MFTPALFPMIRRGEAERGRGSREVEGEERPGGGDSEGEEGGKEVTVTPEAIPLTPPFLGTNCTFGVIFLEEKNGSLKIFCLSHLILGLEQPSW